MNIDNILKRLSQVGASLILLTPILVDSNFLFPFIHMKNLSFRLILSALLIILVWYAFRTGKIFGKKNYILYAIGFLWLTFLLATIFGVNSYNSWWGNYERMDGMLHITMLSLYFFVLINVFQKKEDWLWILRASIFGAFMVSMYGLLQTFGVQNALILKSSSIRISSTIGNPAFLASYLMFNLFFAALLIYWDKVTQWRVLYGLVGILFLFIIYHTGTRGPILGLVAGLLVMGVMYIGKANKKGRIIIASSMLFIILFSAFIYSQRDTEWLKKYHAFYRLAQISLTDSTTKDRLLTWKTSWLSYQDHPILGYGPENFRYGFNKYYNPNLEEQWFDRAHNAVFDYLNSAGILGLLGYFLVLGMAAYYIWYYRHRDYLASVLFAGLLVAYFLQNLFVFDTLNTFLPLMLTLALVSSLGTKEEEGWQMPRSWQAFGPVATGVLLVVLSVFSYHALIKPARANVTAIEAYQVSVVDPEKSLAKYREALEYQTFGNREIAMQLNNFVSNVIRTPNAPANFKLQAFQEAEKWLKSILEKSEHDIQVRMVLAGLYQTYAGIDRTYAQTSIDVLEPYLDDSPDRLEIYFSLAQSYLMTGNVNKSIELLEYAYNLAERKKNTYINLMNVYSQIGNMQRVNELVQEMSNEFELTAGDYSRIARFYYIGKQYSIAVDFNDKAIELDPENFQHYQMKAGLLRELGQYDEAISMLKQIVDINPEWVQTVTTYINQLQQERDAANPVVEE